MEWFPVTYVNENVNGSDRLLTPRDSLPRRRFPRQRVALCRKKKKDSRIGPHLGYGDNDDIVSFFIRSMLSCLLRKYKKKIERALPHAPCGKETTKKTRRRVTLLSSCDPPSPFIFLLQTWCSSPLVFCWCFVLFVSFFFFVFVSFCICFASPSSLFSSHLFDLSLFPRPPCFNPLVYSSSRESGWKGSHRFGW